MMAIMMSFVLLVSGIIPTGHTESITNRSSLDPNTVYVHEWRYDYKGNLIEENKYTIAYSEYGQELGTF